ncbi:MAG: class I SAM-dependent methyltransferase [Anaerolineales bacterium]|nr:class I SAM-dependent methyltransferase [Anaerolineales bacterium]
MIIPAAEIKQALAIANQIPGLYRRGEAAFLYRLARRRGNLVELGCWMGRTTAILLQAASVWKAGLTTVDAFTPMPSQRKRATPEQWRANLKGIGLIPPDLLAMTTDAATEIYSNDQIISLLFIDANHTRQQVRRDLENWTPRIKIGGIVALHDMFYPSITGVCLAVVDWWSTARNGKSAAWKYIGQRDYTIAFQRVR